MNSSNIIPTEKEKTEIIYAINILNKILKNYQNNNEETLIIEFENLINNLIKVRNKYLTELFGLVLIQYSALLTKDVVARLYHHQEYSDSIDRLKKVQNLLQSAVEHLDHSKEFNANKELHDRIYSEIFMLLAFNNMCFRRFYQAKRFAKKAYRYDRNNDTAKALILIIRENNKAEEDIKKAIKKGINPENLPNYNDLISKIALTLVDEHDKDLIKHLRSSLNSEEKKKNLKIHNPIQGIREKLNPRNWKMVQVTTDYIKNDFLKRTGLVLTGLAALVATSTMDVNKKIDGSFDIGTKVSYAAAKVQKTADFQPMPTKEVLEREGYKMIKTYSYHIKQLGDDGVVENYQKPGEKKKGIALWRFKDRDKPFVYISGELGNLVNTGVVFIDDDGDGMGYMRVSPTIPVPMDYEAWGQKVVPNFYENLAKEMEKLNERKQYKKVIEEYAEYSEEIQNRSFVYFNELAGAWFHNNNLEKSAYYFNKSLGFSDNNKVRFNLASVYARMGKFQDSLEQFQIIQKKDKNYPNLTKWMDYVKNKLSS